MCATSYRVFFRLFLVLVSDGVLRFLVSNCSAFSSQAIQGPDWPWCFDFLKRYVHLLVSTVRLLKSQYIKIVYRGASVYKGDTAITSFQGFRRRRLVFTGEITAITKTHKVRAQV
ncbi:hypothetical protein RvY_17343 [Ramazzottius varieornatus]|uniref:Secreted protein n=1 Tax=Ramazzottius varieornatus TaxID=947166 RepID=A0A1D1W1T7_RAMVA|nr:hypothetical protein RvY_17343 [Ramazzottius varieornatus]